MDYKTITPEIPTADPRMRSALDGWLGIYEGLFMIQADHEAFKMRAAGMERNGATAAAEPPPAYGLPSAPMPRPEHIYKALYGAARALNASGVPYAVGGGLAASYLGQNRATRDLDFFVFANKDELAPVMASLAKFDVCPHRLEKPSFMPPDALFWWVPLQFGLPDALPVDVDLLVAEHEYMAMLQANATSSEIADEKVRVLGAEGLVVLKLQAFRDKDRWDVKEILKRNPKLDRALLMSWVAKFKLEERLAQMERELAAEGPRRG